MRASVMAKLNSMSLLCLYFWCLQSCSGDGRLSAINLRKGTLIALSDQIEDELLSVEILKVQA